MDKLPREARALLALATSGHDPPDNGARARVRARLALALAAPAAGSLLGNARAATAPVPPAGAVKGGSWLGAKAWIAAVVVMGAGGATFASMSARRAPIPSTDTNEVVPQQSTTAPDPPAAARWPEPRVLELSALPGANTSLKEPNNRRARDVHSTGRGAAASDLVRETELLSRAAQLLTEHDGRGARELLGEHRLKFHHSQLREEREALFVLAHCIEHPVLARAQAQRFVAQAPASVLVARIERACALATDE